MKAKEYYEQYGIAVLAESYHESKYDELTKLISAFLKEMKATLKERHVSTDRGTVAIIREFNNKWNALSAIFEKKHGVTPLNRNGFLKFMESEIPELERWEKQWEKKC